MQKGFDYTGISIVSFCHDGSGNFVLMKRGQGARDEHGRWDICGGALEFGVSVEATLAKEIAEEYGTEVFDSEFLGFRDVHRAHEGRNTHWLGLDFKVRIDPAKVRIAEPHKFEEMGWFTLDSLPEPLHSQLPVFFEKYRAKLAVRNPNRLA